MKKRSPGPAARACPASTNRKAAGNARRPASKEAEPFLQKPSLSKRFSYKGIALPYLPERFNSETAPRRIKNRCRQQPGCASPSRRCTHKLRLDRFLASNERMLTALRA